VPRTGKQTGTVASFINSGRLQMSLVSAVSLRLRKTWINSFLSHQLQSVYMRPRWTASSADERRCDWRTKWFEIDLLCVLWNADFNSAYTNYRLWQENTKISTLRKFQSLPDDFSRRILLSQVVSFGAPTCCRMLRRRMSMILRSVHCWRHRMSTLMLVVDLYSA